MQIDGWAGDVPTKLNSKRRFVGISLWFLQGAEHAGEMPVICLWLLVSHLELTLQVETEMVPLPESTY